MHSRKNEREAMKDAVEMAVLSSVQHPNIVSVYSCLTDMVDVSGGRARARVVFLQQALDGWPGCELEAARRRAARCLLPRF
jgi:hypothetical protein